MIDELALIVALGTGRLFLAALSGLTRALSVEIGA